MANSASVALAGSVGLSKAMTITPCAWAFLMAGTMALESLGVIKIVLAPAAIMFSMAVTWPALSPSVLPAADSTLAPSFFASACAPSFILTKNGLVSVLVIKPMTGSAAYALVAASTTADSISLGAIDFIESPEDLMGIASALLRRGVTVKQLD